MTLGQGMQGIKNNSDIKRRLGQGPKIDTEEGGWEKNL
jgi:hypothetical protein